MLPVLTPVTFSLNRADTAGVMVWPTELGAGEGVGEVRVRGPMAQLDAVAADELVSIFGDRDTGGNVRRVNGAVGLAGARQKLVNEGCSAVIGGEIAARIQRGESLAGVVAD